MKINTSETSGNSPTRFEWLTTKEAAEYLRVQPRKEKAHKKSRAGKVLEKARKRKRTKTIVNHQLFGRGVVRNFHTTGSLNRVAEVTFEDGDTRTILVSLLSMMAATT